MIKGRMMQSSTCYNPHKIYKLALTNPVVCRLLPEWEQGNVSWEEVLIWMIMDLDKVICDQRLQLGHKLARKTPTSITSKEIRNTLADSLKV